MMPQLFPGATTAFKLQALVYDILPSTTAIADYNILPPTTATVDYAIDVEKLSANERFFDDTQTAVGL